MWPAVRRGSLHGNAVNLGSRPSAALRVPAPSSHKHSLTHDHENFTAYKLHDLHKKNSFRDHGAAIPYADLLGAARSRQLDGIALYRLFALRACMQPNGGLVGL